MKKLLLIVMVLTINPNSVFAEFYNVDVSRVEQNLYKDFNSGVYIVTKYCYEYAYMEKAILSYEPYSYDNKLIFKNNSSCDVEKLLKE